MTDETNPTTPPATDPSSAQTTGGDQSTGPDRDFLEAVVKELVDKPEDVIITRTVDDLGVLITLRVGKDDMSKIIGKSGQTARSIRTLLRVVGSKYDLRVNLKVLEPDGSEYRGGREEGGREGRKPFTPTTAARPAPARPPVAKQAAGGGDAPVIKPVAEQDGASAFDNII